MTGCIFPRACRRSLCPRLAAWPAPLTIWIFRSSSSCLPTNINPLMTRIGEGMPALIPERCAQARQRPQSRQSAKSVAPSSERKELKENQPLTPSTKGKERRGNRQGLSEQQRRQKSQSRQPRHPATSSEGEKRKDNAEGLSERQRRRKRVGRALHQRRTGQPTGKGAKPDKQKPETRKLTRRLEVQLCRQIQVPKLRLHHLAIKGGLPPLLQH